MSNEIDKVRSTYLSEFKNLENKYSKKIKKIKQNQIR